MTVPYEWMMTVHLFMHGDNYNLDALKEAVPKRSEWIERVQRQFEEVLRTRPVTVSNTPMSTWVTKKRSIAICRRSTTTYSAVGLGP